MLDQVVVACHLQVSVDSVGNICINVELQRARGAFVAFVTVNCAPRVQGAATEVEVFGAIEGFVQGINAKLKSSLLQSPAP